MSAPRQCSSDSVSSGPGSFISLVVWSTTIPVVPTMALICWGLSRNESSCTGTTVATASVVVAGVVLAVVARVVLRPLGCPSPPLASASQVPTAATTATTIRTAPMINHGRCLGGAAGGHGGGGALGGVLGHASGDDVIEGRGDALPLQAGPRDGLHEMCTHEGAEVLRSVGRCAGEAFVQHAGQRVDVGTVGDVVVAEPFRRHVAPAAHRGPRLGELVLVGGRGGDAEVDQVGEVVLGDQDVFRFDVAVDDRGAVRGIERGGD